MADYPKAQEVAASPEELDAMKMDSSIVIVMAIEQPNSDKLLVSYFNKDCGMLPPWLRVAA